MSKTTFQLIVVIFTVILGLAALSSCTSSANELKKESIVADTICQKQIEPIDLKWTYINQNIDWESPPKQIKQTFKGSLNSRVVVFYPSGKFASVGCTIYRNNKTKRMSISMGDDFSVLKGTWKQNEDRTITAILQLTHGMIKNYPEQIQIWRIREKSTERLANLLELDRKVYVPLPEVGNFNQLAPMIADDSLPPN